MRALILFIFFTGAISWSIAGTPVMDGIFDGESVWGAPKHIADGVPGWADANAKKLYITDDETYIYFGAEVSAAKWMSWAFIVNTKSGGGSYDSWSRSIDYAHYDLPDYAPRGHFGGGDQDVNYAELNFWNGTAWDGYVGLAQTEFADTISVNHVVDGWIEIRIPKADMDYPGVGDVQFYITGDNNDHGNFDACPDDENATDWNMSGNHNILDNYQMNINLNTTPSTIGETGSVARSFTLLGNFPNPFNPATQIRFTTAQKARVQLNVINTNGQLIYSAEKTFSPGEHSWKFSTNELNVDLTSGVYFYTLSNASTGQKLVGKMVLLK
ncbi:MAG: T9SS type A sorting domain-containing protein [Caldisericaceae bacterium]|nr:T9SS type A sorting domain-containing protein [Caldisericaceae bacterium]